MRFHKKRATFLKKGTDANGLLEALEQCLPKENGRLERRRTCGSSGRTTYSKQFMELMDTHNSCPKNARVVFRLRGTNEKWHLIYNNTSEGETKEFEYSNPVHGGQLVMDTKLFKRYPFLVDFISTKPYAALLLKQVEAYLKDKLDVSISICPVSVQGELENIESARFYLQDRKEKHCVRVDLAKKGIVPWEQLSPPLKPKRNNQKKQTVDPNLQKKNKKTVDPNTLRYEINPRELKHMFYVWYSVMFLSFTLIEHPVGAHLDTFGGCLPSLENRLAFAHRPDAKDYHVGTGRGGGGLYRHGWALFDWGCRERNRRRVWTHPANAHLIGSEQFVRNAHNINDNDSVQRLTPDQWRSFYQSNMNQYFIPLGIDEATLVPEEN